MPKEPQKPAKPTPPKGGSPSKDAVRRYNDKLAQYEQDLEQYEAEYEDYIARLEEYNQIKRESVKQNARYEEFEE